MRLPPMRGREFVASQERVTSEAALSESKRGTTPTIRENSRKFAGSHHGRAWIRRDALGRGLNMGNWPERLRTTRIRVRSSSSRLSDVRGDRASVLHQRSNMETLVLTAAMMLSGLLAIGSTRALLGLVLLAITRDVAAR